MSTNPFDEDYKDYTGATTASGPIKKYTTLTSIPEDDIDYYEREMEKYMQQSLDSTERSRRQLEQSEKIGISTAQDLLEQREKLEKTEKNLDDIDRTTKVTQRNLNSLKSFFGGFFKNKFSRAPKENASPQVPNSTSENTLSKTIGNLDSTPYTGGAVSQTGPSLSETSRAAIKGTRWEVMDNEIDANLDSMSAHLARLNELGRAIGTEVDSQNELLDRIQTKAERNEASVRNQDRQMKKLLGNVERQEKNEPTVPSVSKSKIMMSAIKGAF